MDILQTLFEEVLTLEACVYRLYGNDTLRSTLLQEADTDSYRSLLLSTLVGIPAAMRPFCVRSVSQHLHQKEVILRAIEHIMKRDGPGTNVLTFGFGLMSDDQNAHISSGLNVEYKYPNNNVSKLHYRDWKLLHGRIGDELMMYLLENLSLFVEIQPTCYLQLTGSPVYNMWPYGSRRSPWVTPQTAQGTADTGHRGHPGENRPSQEQTHTAVQVNDNSVTSIPRPNKRTAPKSANSGKNGKYRKKAKAGARKRSGNGTPWKSHLVQKSSTSISNIRNSVGNKCLKFKRRKFETSQNDPKYVKLRQESEVYARQMVTATVGDNGTPSHCEGTSDADIDGQLHTSSGHVIGKLTKGVKGKLSEKDPNPDLNVNQMGGNTKVCGSSSSTRSNDVVRNEICVPRCIIMENSNVEQVDKCELSPMEHNFNQSTAMTTSAADPDLVMTSDRSRKRKACSDGVITGSVGVEADLAPKRRKLSSDQCRSQEQMARRQSVTATREHRQKGDVDKQCNIRPYSHSLVLPRSRIFYQRNIRERLPKTAVLKASQLGGVQLYREILLTSVHTTKPETDINILLPDVSPASQTGDEPCSSNKTGPSGQCHGPSAAPNSNNSNPAAEQQIKRVFDDNYEIIFLISP